MKKYKILSCLLCVVVFSYIFSGCVVSKRPIDPERLAEIDVKENENPKPQINVDQNTQPKQEKVTSLPGEFPLELVFSSGVGGWGTFISVNEDGSFEGNYHDSEMGINGEGYDGTMYICDFTGKFGNIEKIDEYTYSMDLEEINITSEEPGKQWIEERVKYIASEPYGLEDGEKYLLYVPETPVVVLNEEFLSWWPYRFSYNEEPPKTLTVYGIYNVKMGYGFFSQKY